MKNLKITLATLALTVFANLSMAQNEVQKTPEERAAAQTERMSEKLILSPEQKEQIGQINLAIIQKNDAVKNDQAMSDETKQQSYKGNDDARTQMIKPLLDPEQLKKFEEMEAARQIKIQRTGNMQRQMKPVDAAPAPVK